MTRRKKTTPRHPEVALIHKLIRKSFDGNLERTSQWFFQPLDQLGETPNEMIMSGRHKALLDYVLELTGTISRDALTQLESSLRSFKEGKEGNTFNLDDYKELLKETNE